MIIGDLGPQLRVGPHIPEARLRRVRERPLSQTVLALADGIQS